MALSLLCVSGKYTCRSVGGCSVSDDIEAAKLPRRLFGAPAKLGTFGVPGRSCRFSASANGSSRGRRAAFSYLETMAAAFILGLIVVAALRASAYTAAAQLVAERYLQASMLADELMAEIATKDYQDPEAPGSFGPEPGEVTGNRSAFDDVDDYDGWSAEPPTTPDGGSLGDFPGFRREVRVEQVSDTDPTTIVAVGASGTKRVTVTVTWGSRVTVTRQCLFTLNATQVTPL